MGLMSKKNEDLTITRKAADGTTVTVKSPNGSSMDMLGLFGGLVEGQSPTPVADNVPAMLTAGEFVVNQPAAQKYKGLLRQINQEGRRALKQGGWIAKEKPMGYANGGEVQGPRGGLYKKVGANWVAIVGNREFPVKDSSVIEWLNNRYGGARTGQLLDAQPLSNPTVNTGGQQYPGNVVLDPNSSDQADFQRMNTLVENGLFDISQDRAGRAIYQLTDLGKAHNVRAQGSGVDNFGATAADPRVNQIGYSGVSADPVMDNYIANLSTKYGGRGETVEAPGAREDIYKYGQAGQAPTVTPEGTQIKYKAGSVTQVASKEQAMQFVSAGIVEVGAKFIVQSTGEEGVAQ